MALPPKFAGQRFVAATEGVSTQALHSLELYLDFVCPVSGFWFWFLVLFWGGEEGVGPDRDHSALGSIAGHRELRPSESLVSILSLIMPFLETTKKKPRQSKTMAT